MHHLDMPDPDVQALDRSSFDPDHQQPLPFAAAEDYARTVMGWSRDAMPDTVTAVHDIAYGEHRLHRYNLFAPRGAQQAPLLVFWHGGGWTNGYRDYVSFMAPHLVRRGYALVAPSYRLATDTPLPAALEDCFALLDHLASHAPLHGADTGRTYLAGHSAGGHLAALTALRYPHTAPQGQARCGVRGCLPISAIMDMHHPAPQPGSLEERVYTTVLGHPDDDALMSPLCWTAGNRIPFVVTYGAHDSARVQHSNRRMLALLRAQEGPASLQVEASTDHFASHTMLRDGAHPWYDRLDQLERETRICARKSSTSAYPH